MKAIKKLFKFLFWTLVVLVVFVLALPLWIGPVVTTVANKTVPGIVKTDFNLGVFGLNPYTGTCRVGDLQLANPEGFPKENCVALGTFKVNLDVPSVWTKKIHVEEITLDGLTVATTVTGANFKQIAANVSGEPAATAEAPASGETAAAPETPAEAPARASAETKAEEAPHVVIDRLTLKNIVVKLNGLPIPVPPLTLEGIGADKAEGASLMDAWQEIFNKVLNSAGALGSALGDLGKGVTEAANAALSAGTEAANAALAAGTDAANAALSAGTDAANAALSAGTEAVGTALGSIQNVDLSGATTAVGDGAGAVMDTLKDAGGTALNVGTDAAGAVGDGAGAVMDTLKDAGGTAVDGAGKALNAVGDGAGKALDAIKGLW